MKFDVVIGNPPYKRDLHLQFLSKAIDLSKRFVIFVHPAQWLINNRSVKKTNICQEVLDKIEGKVKELTLLDLSKRIPEVKMHSLSDIILIDKQGSSKAKVINDVLKESWEVSTFKGFHPYGYSSLYDSIKIKIGGKDTLFNHLKQNGNYFVNIPFVRGGIFKDNFFTFVSKSYKIETDPNYNYIGFESREAATNLLTYLKTYFARFCLIYNKTDVRLTGNTGKIVNSIPWLDFTKKWDDEKLFKYFNLTKEEAEFIYKHIPAYYLEVSKVEI